MPNATVPFGEYILSTVFKRIAARDATIGATLPPKNVRFVEVDRKVRTVLTIANATKTPRERRAVSV